MIEEHDQPGALDVQKAKGEFNILKQVLNVCARRASTAKNVKLHFFFLLSTWCDPWARFWKT